MKRKAADTALYSIRIFLMVFWLYVALDKLWNLGAFHRALLRQPFPDWWADTLYWTLPLAELGLSLLFIFSKKRYPYLLSAILMLVFTIYIGLGVMGFYAERPCGCASVFSGLSWKAHLLVNTFFVTISILGCYLSKPTAITNGQLRHKRNITLFQSFIKLIAVAIHHTIVTIRRKFPRRFALFPGRRVGI